MNKIKAILHNRCLYTLIHDENPVYDYIIVDEFAREARYYEYLNGTRHGWDLNAVPNLKLGER